MYKDGQRLFYNNEVCTFNAKVNEHFSLVTFYNSDSTGDPDQMVNEIQIQITVPTDKLHLKRINVGQNFERKERAHQKKLDENYRKHHLELLKIQKVIKESEKRLAQVPKLARLFDYIDGKITHIVFIDYGCEIHEFNAIVRAEPESRYNKEMKLLTLFGNTNGDLNWKLSNWSDGSGSAKTVLLAQSKEQALELIREHLIEQTTSETAKKYKSGWVVSDILKYGFEHESFPDYIASYNEESNRQHQENIKRAEDELEKLKNKATESSKRYVSVAAQPAKI